MKTPEVYSAPIYRFKQFTEDMMPKLGDCFIFQNKTLEVIAIRIEDLVFDLVEITK